MKNNFDFKMELLSQHALTACDTCYLCGSWYVHTESWNQGSGSQTRTSCSTENSLVPDESGSDF